MATGVSVAEGPRGTDAPPRLVLVLGGARSGKSAFAERLAENSPRSVTYVATASNWGDPEMADRIARHRARRPDGWTTREVPRELARMVRADAVPGELLLVDCLTLWLTNVMLGPPEATDAEVEAAIGGLVAALGDRHGPVILVSNEVGDGIVPETPLGRRFRDHQGRLNQMVAHRATDVVRLVAGCPLVVKPAPAPDIVL